MVSVLPTRQATSRFWVFSAIAVVQQLSLPVCEMFKKLGITHGLGLTRWTGLLKRRRINSRPSRSHANRWSGASGHLQNYCKLDTVLEYMLGVQPARSLW
jgi:hypothetical protein